MHPSYRMICLFVTCASRTQCYISSSMYRAGRSAYRDIKTFDRAMINLENVQIFVPT